MMARSCPGEDIRRRWTQRILASNARVVCYWRKVDIELLNNTRL